MDMNDLKESNEAMKQTTDELKSIVDAFHKEKHDWVLSNIPRFFSIFFSSRLKKPILKVWKKKFVI